METQDKRPLDRHTREKLRKVYLALYYYMEYYMLKSDSYGDKKLKCEELLRELHQRNPGEFPFITLRLPDVIGPYDDSNRYWLYLRWAREILDKDLEVDDEGNEVLLSLVFSEDVADLLMRLLLTQDRSKILSESFNLAFEENYTLKQVL